MSLSARHANAMRMAPTESGSGAFQGVGKGSLPAQLRPFRPGWSWKISCTIRETRRWQSNSPRLSTERKLKPPRCRTFSES